MDPGHVLLTMDALLHPRAGEPPAWQWQFTREAIARFFQWLLDQLQTEQDRFD